MAIIKWRASCKSYDATGYDSVNEYYARFISSINHSPEATMWLLQMSKFDASSRWNGTLHINKTNGKIRISVLLTKVILLGACHISIDINDTKFWMPDGTLNNISASESEEIKLAVAEGKIVCKAVVQEYNKVAA